MAPSLTVAVISRHSLIYLGFQSILAGVGTVVHLLPGVMSEALRTERHPDLFVLDLETDRDAIDMIRQIRSVAPTSKIIVLSGVEEARCLHAVFAYGVDGILLKIQPPEVVLATIKALSTPTPHYARVSRDGSVDGGSGAVAKPVVDPALPPVWLDAVTAREREIIRLVGQGLSNKEIAHRLCVTDSTVRHHLTNIFDKVGVSSRQKLLVQTHQFCSASTSSP